MRPALRRGLAGKAVARHGISIALACRTFGISETCYRYSPLLSDENEEIADLLVGLTDARKPLIYWKITPSAWRLVSQRLRQTSSALSDLKNV